jgi:hypothetical protein
MISDIVENKTNFNTFLLSKELLLFGLNLFKRILSPPPLECYRTPSALSILYEKSILQFL